MSISDASKNFTFMYLPTLALLSPSPKTLSFRLNPERSNCKRKVRRVPLRNPAYPAFAVSPDFFSALFSPGLGLPTALLLN